jgi:hypothetical protein
VRWLLVRAEIVARVFFAVASDELMSCLSPKHPADPTHISYLFFQAFLDWYKDFCTYLMATYFVGRLFRAIRRSGKFKA